MNTFIYDVRERLTGVSRTGSSASYLINPLGQRIKKTVTPASGPASHTLFTYDDAGHLVAEAHSDGGDTQRRRRHTAPHLTRVTPCPHRD